jgi:hypothetical protein
MLPFYPLSPSDSSIPVKNPKFSYPPGCSAKYLQHFFTFAPEPNGFVTNPLGYVPDSLD